VDPNASLGQRTGVGVHNGAVEFQISKNAVWPPSPSRLRRVRRFCCLACLRRRPGPRGPFGLRLFRRPP